MEDVVEHLVDNPGDPAVRTAREGGKRGQVPIGQAARRGRVPIDRERGAIGARGANACASASTARPSALLSPAPNTWLWLAAICSTRVEPDRGMPMMNTGNVDGLPQEAARARKSGVTWAIRRSIAASKAAASKRCPASAWCLTDQGVGGGETRERFVEAAFDVEHLTQGEAGGDPILGRQIRAIEPVRQAVDVMRLRPRRAAGRQAATCGELIRIEGKCLAKA